VAKDIHEKTVVFVDFIANPRQASIFGIGKSPLPMFLDGNHG
jgi:hypothetical protein